MKQIVETIYVSSLELVNISTLTMFHENRLIGLRYYMEMKWRMYRRTKSDEIKGGNCFVFLHKERKNNYNKTTAVTTRTIKKKKKKKKKKKVQLYFSPI